MISLAEAISLATEAHKDQWRKPDYDTYMSIEDTVEVNSSPNSDEHVLSNGDIIVWDNTNEYYIRKKPYISHPLAVMEMMDTEEEKIIAVLHDVIEDTDYKHYEECVDNEDLEYMHYLVSSKDSSKSLEIEMWLAITLLLLTHKKHESYEEYISRIATSYNRYAIKVKLADILHNLSDNPSTKQKERYLKSLPTLLKAL